MTAFGKLLVIMNLLFSVFTGALIVYVFTTRANWVGAHQDAVAKAKAAEAAYKAEKTAHDNDIKQKDATLEEMKKQMEQLTSRVALAQADAQKAQELADKQIAVNRGLAAQTESAQAELKQIRDERNVLDTEKTALRQQVVKIQDELGKQVKLAVEAELRAKNMDQKANNLLRQVEELTVRNRELEAHTPTGTPGRGGSTSILDGVTKPAPPGVYGKVTQVSTNSSSGLAQIDIGSDSQLSVGNTLTVYRGVEFVGELTLTTITAKTAVGRFTPHKRTSVIKVGDNVATSLSGTPQ